MSGATTHPMIDALHASVTLEILALRDVDPVERIELAKSRADDLQDGADSALYGGKGALTRGSRYFAALTRVLAVMAYQPGGVTAFDQHWCVNHAECREAAAYAAAQVGRRTEDVTTVGDLL